MSEREAILKAASKVRVVSVSTLEALRLLHQPNADIDKVVQVIETRDAKIALDIKRAEEARNEASTVSTNIEDKIIHARDHARTILALAARRT